MNSTFRYHLLSASFFIFAAASASVITGCGKSDFLTKASAPASSTDSIAIVPEDTIGSDLYLDYSAIAGNEKTGASRIALKGLTRAEVEERLRGSYRWDMHLIDNSYVDDADEEQDGEESGSRPAETVVKPAGSSSGSASYKAVSDQGRSYAVEDLIGKSIQKQLDDLFEKEGGKTGTDHEGDYVLSLPDFRSEAADVLADVTDKWNKKATPGVLTGYDKATGHFQFGPAVRGYKLDTQATLNAIVAACEARDYTANVEAIGTAEDAAGSMEDQYRIIGSFTTHTTANNTRNTNVRLASEAINGLILQPGEEFSFNDVVGQRTTAKGYGPAGAYSNGEVVQEVGGGVCQVSTTLYNAVFYAGLESTLRSSHTFEPSYVTPGRDATVSWGGPNYKFKNTSEYPICVLEHYENRTVTAEIYGVPVLEDGVTLELECQKTGANAAGSTWTVYKITKKNGNTIERVQDHVSRYKAHTEANDAAAAAAAASKAAAEAAAASQAAEAAAEASRAAETAAPTTPAAAGPAGPAGPASEATDAAPAPTAPAAETQAPAVPAPAGPGQG